MGANKPAPDIRGAPHRAKHASPLSCSHHLTPCLCRGTDPAPLVSAVYPGWRRTDTVSSALATIPDTGKNIGFSRLRPVVVGQQGVGLVHGRSPSAASAATSP